MIILTWNVRGLGDHIKRGGVKNFCQLNKVDILYIQESKLDNSNEFIFRSLDDSFINDWVVKDATGSSGRLMIGWKCQFGKKLRAESATFCLMVVLESVNKEIVWAISNTYGPHNFDVRSFFMVFGLLVCLKIYPFIACPKSG